MNEPKARALKRSSMVDLLHFNIFSPGTFHCMGRIACVTPKNAVISVNKVEKLCNIPSAVEMMAIN